VVAPANLWRFSHPTCSIPVEAVSCGVVRGMGYAVEILVRSISQHPLSANLEVRVSSIDS
jgi:hypothetical protein